jgi:hypothetical protein
MLLNNNLMPAGHYEGLRGSMEEHIWKNKKDSKPGKTCKIKQFSFGRISQHFFLLQPTCIISFNRATKLHLVQG